MRPLDEGGKSGDYSSSLVFTAGIYMSLERVFGGAHSRLGDQAVAERIIKHREVQIEAMRRVAEAALEFTSVDDLIRETLAIAKDVVGAESGSLQLYDPASDCLIFRHVVDGKCPNLVGLAVAASHGINGHVFRTGISEINHNVQSCPEWNPEVDRFTGAQTRSLLTVALKKHGGQPIGVIQMVNGEDGIDHFDLEVLEILAGQLAQSLAVAELRSESDRRMAGLQALDETGRIIAETTDDANALVMYLERVTEHLRLDAARLFLFRSATSRLECAAVTGFRHAVPEPFYVSGDTPLLQAVTSKQVVVSRPADSNFHSEWKEEDFVAVHSVPLVCEGELKGVMELGDRVGRQPESEWNCLLGALASRAALLLDRAVGTAEVRERLGILQRQYSGYQHQFYELSSSFDSTLEKLAHALDVRNMEPEGHTFRVAEYTIKLGRHLGLSEEDLVHLRRGALLHNIGKIAIPDAVLLKSTALTDDEWAMVRKHPIFAFELLSTVEVLRPALDIPYCCHERWDGMGYPRGLQGEKIPLGARIFALADAWDAMRADRPYRVGWPPERVRSHIVSSSGSQFDPYIVQAFEQISFG